MGLIVCSLSQSASMAQMFTKLIKARTNQSAVGLNLKIIQIFSISVEKSPKATFGARKGSLVTIAGTLKERINNKSEKSRKQKRATDKMS